MNRWCGRPYDEGVRNCGMGITMQTNENANGVHISTKATTVPAVAYWHSHAFECKVR